MKRNALGRGLGSYFNMDDIQTNGSSAISNIEISLITPNPGQPRTTFDDEALKELAASIAEVGIIQPLTLRKIDDDRYQIISGERRYRAAKIAGLESVPAYIREANDTELTEMALIENIQREDLNAIEIALTFKKLIEQYNLTQERLSERIGKKRTTIANFLRLLKLPAEIQLGLRDKKLDMGHARAILATPSAERQLALYQRILKEGLSVRKVEELAQEDKAESKKPKDKNANPYAALEKELSAKTGFKIKVQSSKVTIAFADENELAQIAQRLG